MKPEELPITRRLKVNNKTTKTIESLQNEIRSKQAQMEIIDDKNLAYDFLPMIDERPLLAELVDASTSKELGLPVDDSHLKKLQDDLKKAKKHNAETLILNEQRDQISTAMEARSSALAAELRQLKAELKSLVIDELTAELNSQRELYRSHCLQFLDTLSAAHNLSEQIRVLSLQKDRNQMHLQPATEFSSFFGEHRLTIPVLPALQKQGHSVFLNAQSGFDLPKSSAAERLYRIVGIDPALLS